MRPWHFQCNVREINVRERRWLGLWWRKDHAMLFFMTRLEENWWCLVLWDSQHCWLTHKISCYVSLWNFIPQPPKLCLFIFLFLLTAWVQFILLSGDIGVCECRETLVVTDKPTLTLRPAGGTRFTKKTMSTRSHGISHTHIHNPHRRTPPENLPHAQINFNTYQQTVTMKKQCFA